MNEVFYYYDNILIPNPAAMAQPCQKSNIVQEMSWVCTCVAKNTLPGSLGRLLSITRLLQINPPLFLYVLAAKINPEFPLATVDFIGSACIAM